MGKLLRSNWLPRLVTAAGLVALIASTACFALPNITIPGTRRPYNTPSPMGPTPSPSGEATPSPSPAGSPTASPSSAPNLAPTVGRKYTFAVTGASPSTVVIEVTGLASDQVTFTMTTTPGNASPTVQNGLTAKPVHGVYWPFSGPNPVTADIGTYPHETVTVKAGTFEANKVTAADGTVYWFSQGLEVKSQGASGTTELEDVR